MSMKTCWTQHIKILAKLEMIHFKHAWTGLVIPLLSVESESYWPIMQFSIQIWRIYWLRLSATTAQYWKTYSRPQCEGERNHPNPKIFVRQNMSYCSFILVPECSHLLQQQSALWQSVHCLLPLPVEAVCAVNMCECPYTSLKRSITHFRTNGLKTVRYISSYLVFLSSRISSHVMNTLMITVITHAAHNTTYTLGIHICSSRYQHWNNFLLIVSDCYMQKRILCQTLA